MDLAFPLKENHSKLVYKAKPTLYYIQVTLLVVSDLKELLTKAWTKIPSAF
jgi:hypothetical protein